MAGDKSYPPTTSSGAYVQRPVVVKARIKLRRTIRAFFKKHAPRVAEEIARYAGLHHNKEGLAKSDDDDAAEEARRKAESAVDHVDIPWEDLPDDVQQYLATVAVAGGQLAADRLDVELPDTFGDGMRERAEAWARDRSAEMVGMRRQGDFLVENPNAEWRIDDSTRDLLRSYTADAIEAGDSTDDFADRISNSFAFSDERAEMIARTEIAKADSQGSLIGWGESGVVSGKSWLTAEDDKVSDECMANEEAGIVPLDFDYGDGVDAPPEHPNCRCVLLPETISDEEASD
jgi:SPP1 gp7 family putative phage head morphogenesis protein